ncbi:MULTISPECIES: hypothetical protein [unclassified Paenibacillus]|uniref:hypothetical protein n=1 Tax=unclassified Paenibacillus TaxID=185978 RepID=UPI00020D700A|nr:MULTISPECIES: hypothetical protein [unclassified Paenibacillus]EGL20059.1 hypothetical protein HMPREF9413_1084 [Paenibacillus sp. HGF7]EPD82020.1 hypothetical protein HMPREF1207_03846 [Paenibacillus sp. HGH0039]
MPVTLEKIYDVFYSSINEDLAKHPELDVNVPDNIVDTFLNSAVYEYEENFGEEIICDTNKTEILNDIPRHHIRLLGKLIYKSYMERELNSCLKLSNHFNKRSELQVIGLQSKIVALKEITGRLTQEINRMFTRGILKGISKLG